MARLKIKGSFDFKQDLKSQQMDYEFCTRPLFHGTRKYAIEVSEEKRLEFFKACYEVALFAKKLISIGKIKYNIVIMQVGENSAFEYGDLYLISTYTTAISYAHNIAGELGKNVFLICEEIKRACVELDDRMQMLIDMVMKEYENYKVSEKIILVYMNVKFVDLYTCGGSPFIDVDDVEYTQYMIEELYNEKEKLGYLPNTSFRLKNPEQYEAYIIKEKDLRNGFAAFTNIIDVDGHLRSCRKEWDI